MSDFQKKVDEVLRSIGEENLGYNPEEGWLYADDYNHIMNFAREVQLYNTALALPIVRSLHDGTYRGYKMAKDGTRHPRPYFCHCLSVCRMLMNLHIPLKRDEKDILLAAALCHDLKVYISFPRDGWEMAEQYHLDPRIPEIMNLIYDGHCHSSEDYRQLFERVQENKLAMLVRLSDRGNIVEELHSVPTWKAHEYIHETRTHYLSMCIYAKEHYPELETTIGILQGKIKELMEATEIFVNRYENRERELTNQILALKEENSRMRILLRKKREKEAWIHKHMELMKQKMAQYDALEVERLSNAEIQELADKAQMMIPERVEHFAKLIGVDYGRITIRNQKTRWGSCSSKGNLNFNCLLMLTPPDVLDYVVVHELCHRKEMNHSKAFWSEVEKVLPDYKELVRWLKEEGSHIAQLSH